MELSHINEKKRRKLDRQITGIIQKDRIWEQWYDQEIFKLKLPKMSQKDYLFQCIDNDKNRIMLNNRNMKKFTVSETKKMIMDYERAFAAMSLQKGNVICTIGLSTPELYAIKYAATSLGLITCNLNIFDIGIMDDNGKNRLFNQLKKVNPKMIFTLDLFEDKIYQVINSEEFARAVKVSMPLSYSTNMLNPERPALALKTLKNFLSGKAIKEKINLKEFLSFKNSISIDNIEEVYKEKLPCNISFTSGTTGVNKAVLLSHDANNALAFQHKIGGFNFERKSKNLALVPPFLAFWDADVVHTVLCLEGENIIELALEYDKIPKYFQKYDANIGIWSQYLWSSILNLPEDKLKKISSNLKHAIVGGERCEINAAETFYNKTGIIQMTGFGATEVNTAFTLTHPDCIKVGTCGIPLPFNNVKIVDESFNDLTYNKPGKLFITGPCLMNGYYHRDDLTSKAIYYDENGTPWYNTGDYAVLDDDGCLTVLDRYFASVEINTNEKINPLDIAEEIKKNRNVKNCKITFHQGKFVLHLSIDLFTGLSKNDALNNILETIQNNLEEKYWPTIIQIYEELPRTQVGKVDYTALNLIGEELCNTYNSTEKLIVINPQEITLKRRK